jgi:hypothetical protein
MCLVSIIVFNFSFLRTDHYERLFAKIKVFDGDNSLILTSKFKFTYKVNMGHRHIIVCHYTHSPFDILLKAIYNLP